MNVQLLKLRGVLSIGVVWGAVWAAFFAAFVMVLGIFRPQDIGPGEGPIEAGAILRGVGLLSGILFGILLYLAGGVRRIRDVALGRAAAWGVLASSVFPLLTGRADQVFMLCPLGAITGVAVIAATRAAR